MDLGKRGSRSRGREEKSEGCWNVRYVKRVYAHIYTYVCTHAHFLEVTCVPMNTCAEATGRYCLLETSYRLCGTL